MRDGLSSSSSDTGEYAVIVAPEPLSWLEDMVATVSAERPVVLFAPWAMGRGWARLAERLPGRAASFVRRRALSVDCRAVTLPGWTIGESALRAWVNGRADRVLEARFWVRRAVDIWVARWLARATEPPYSVLAPSLAARRTFARAGVRGVRTVLLEDLPGIRALHRDLDMAARVHPECLFLRRFRAPESVVIRQEVERVLADTLLVRGAYARDERLAAGVPDERVARVPVSSDIRPTPRTQPTARRARSDGRYRVLLAGLAAARHGTVEALMALEERAHLELLVRPGEGMEPAGLMEHSRVHAATAEQLAQLAGVDLVIAPSWCETYPRELTLAQACGVPVVATRRAAGFTEPTRMVEPGDARALGQAMDQILTGNRS